jgi:AcrR family transcriptional regulator
VSATKHRAIDAATVAFAERGVAATSLDWLAGQLGVTKQTILYHFGSKDGLVEAVFTTGAHDLVEALRPVIQPGNPAWDQVDRVVRASFDLAIRRPELVGLLREAGRLGAPGSELVVTVLQPLVDRAVDFLEQGMRAGRFRPGDPQMLVVAAYAVVTGVIAGPEVLRTVHLDLDLRVAARLRRTLLSFLRAELVGRAPAPTG